MVYKPYVFFTYQTNGALMSTNAGQQLLDVTWDSGSTSTFLKGPDATAENLVLFANSTDSFPAINLIGGNDLCLCIPTGQSIGFCENDLSSKFISIDVSGSDNIIQGSPDQNMYIAVNGTGQVKFGTHTGLGAEVLSGYITILDAAGNPRKLAVIS